MTYVFIYLFYFIAGRADKISLIGFFFQFEQNVLECCLYLLTDVGRLSKVARADPVKVVRHTSAVVLCLLILFVTVLFI